MEISWQAELERAARETGLNDFGGEGFHAGLKTFAEAINRDPKMSPEVKERTRGMINGTLVKRLNLYRDRRQNPEIAAQKIEKPLIVIGMPRSGTTFLLALLAQDPRARSPLSWEVQTPSPPPRAETEHTDPRIAECQARMDLLPIEFQRMHLSGAMLPEECNAITALAFQSSNLSAGNDIPGYVEWYLSANDADPYQFHTHFLQHLQAFTPKQWWVLKSPPHMFHMARLLETYPDARIVWPHRDPAATLPSLASLIAHIRSGNYEHVDHPSVGREMATYWRTAFQRAMAARAREPDDSRFVDVHYELMISQPLAAVQKVYDHFGIPFTDEARTAMQTFLDEKPKDKLGAHRYTLEEFGLDKDKVHEEYADYLSRYGVALV